MDAFCETYNRLKAENLNLLNEIYSFDIHFTDPAHELRGLVQLKEYVRNLYANLSSIHFEYLHPQRVGNHGYVPWLMTYVHPRLNKGKPVSLPGATYLQFDASGKACVHSDYFDLGAMLYQHLPIFGPAVRIINKMVGQ